MPPVPSTGLKRLEMVFGGSYISAVFAFEIKIWLSHFVLWALCWGYDSLKRIGYTQLQTVLGKCSFYRLWSLCSWKRQFYETWILSSIASRAQPFEVRGKLERTAHKQITCWQKDGTFNSIISWKHKYVVIRSINCHYYYQRRQLLETFYFSTWRPPRTMMTMSSGGTY